MTINDNILTDKQRLNYTLNTIVVDNSTEATQTLKCVEELAELQQALLKFFGNDNKETKQHLIEEIADVENTIQQLFIMYSIPPEVIDDMQTYKAKRTLYRLGVEVFEIQ